MNIKTVCAMGAVLSLCSVANAGPVLDAVKARGQVICGVNTAAPGFASADSKGQWTRLDVDTFLAAALYGFAVG